MKDTKVIIVGGGPSGAACAFQLRQKGIDVLVLETKPFPRQKICAGWITPGVLKILGVKPEGYPHGLKKFNRLYYHLFGIKIPVSTCQYAIRRIEFDQWMISRANVEVKTHTVKQITKEEGGYVVDGMFRCQYLIGAGGTHCPVFKQFFKKENSRFPKAMISAVEAEFIIDIKETNCHLWFFENRLPGYAWYLPKANNYVNIGIGAKQFKLKKHQKTIMDHWHGLVEKLVKLSWVKNVPNPKGHVYYIRHKTKVFQKANAFIVGDAAGLSTLDMGEGIHAAIVSGLFAANAIANKKSYNPSIISKWSLPGILMQHRSL
ncbi:MAG: NAD(P)/FAD-dependent oxidoreductase [Desulfobacteraceae bacterium]|nr:NAD(P)/FAD-dependent oxidoreductase [Desulfobacteraceae bacterium]